MNAVSFHEQRKDYMKEVVSIRNAILAQKLNIHRLKVGVQDVASKRLKTIGP